MYKVILWTKEQLVIEDSQLDGVTANMMRDKPFWLNHKGGRDFIRPSAISRVTKATTLDYNPTVLSDNNRARIAEAKTKAFLSRRELNKGDESNGEEKI